MYVEVIASVLVANDFMMKFYVHVDKIVLVQWSKRKEMCFCYSLHAE